MKSNYLLISLLLATSLLLVPKVGARTAEERAPATAPEAIAVLLSALAASDVDRAVATTTRVKNVTVEMMREYYRRMAKYSKEAGSPQVVAHLQLGDAAVVVVRDSGTQKSTIVDLDPAYLVRRNGKWLVLFRFEYRDDRPYLEFDEALRGSFRRLQKWFDSEKPMLQALVGGRS